MADTEKVIAKLEQMDVNEEPTLHSGELVVRQAGKKEGDGSDVHPATSFSSLNISEDLKRGVAKMGWQTMSKIQQVGLPLLLLDPPK